MKRLKRPGPKIKMRNCLDFARIKTLDSRRLPRKSPTEMPRCAIVDTEGSSSSQKTTGVERKTTF